MDWGKFTETFRYENIQYWLDQYQSLGPIPGIVLPMLEALFPILPLIAIIIGNAAAYGMWEGFFYSWVGACLGSVLVFLAARKLGRPFRRFLRNRYPKSRAFFRWIEKKGFAPLFLLSSLPFSPSSLINLFSGIASVPLKTFFIAIASGKSIMILFISFMGHDLESLIYNPWKLISFCIILLVLWIAARKLERRIR